MTSFDNNNNNTAYNVNGLSLEEEAEDDDEYCLVYDEFGCVALENYVNGQDFDDDDEFRLVRVEKEPDPVLQDIRTPQDVLSKIAQVKQLQAKHGNADLYPRKWENANDNDRRMESEEAVNGGDINGQTINDKSAVNGGASKAVNGGNIADCFTVMQLNALAEGLSSGPLVKKPFQLDPNDSRIRSERSSQFGGFTDIPVPEISLDFALRRWRLVEVLINSPVIGDQQAELFDIIAMEEVDRFRGFFAPILELFGYDSLFVPKTRAPGVRMGWYSDGCSLSWRRDRFELLGRPVKRAYAIGNQVYLLAVLRHVSSKKLVVVAVSHLKAQQNEECEAIRAKQAEELLHQVSSTVNEATNNHHPKDPTSVLILGDFNADPPSNAAEGESTNSAIGRIVQAKLELTGHGGVPVRSAYKVDPPADVSYTTWKTRGAKTVRRIIDYIFYAGKTLECDALLSIPAESELESTKLPGLRHPSDHMMIAAKFRL